MIFGGPSRSRSARASCAAFKVRGLGGVKLVISDAHTGLVSAIETVVGTFPNPAALLRLAGHVLIQQHDEWDGADRRYFSAHSMKLLTTAGEEMTIPELNAA